MSEKTYLPIQVLLTVRDKRELEMVFAGYTQEDLVKVMLFVTEKLRSGEVTNE